jgi:mono/diheme cytochrome c family protein
MTKKTALLRLVLAPILVISTGVRPSAQPGSVTTTWDRVFADAQAARGRAAYEASCSSCHGADLAGGDARSLVGDQFWQSWGEDRLSSLYEFMRAGMPQSAPGSLDPGAYLDIVAFILQRNGYPSGEADLTAERADAIRVTRREGPGPVPNFSLVAVVGCLGERARGVWELTSASDPVRTRNPSASVDAERRRWESTPLGAHSFELMDALQAGSHRGHRMEVKGLLMRGTPDRLNVTSMQMLAERCLP